VSDLFDAAVEVLNRYGQSHLLRTFDDLEFRQQQSLLNQISEIDWQVIEPWLGDAGRVRREGSGSHLPPDPAPAEAFNPGDDAELRASAQERGESILRAGQVAVFTVAGGQGTRLGWRGPKGTYPGTALTGKPLFRIFAEQILAAQKRYGVTIPWLIMTSPMNDAATRAFMTDNNCFGLARRNIAMFPQAMLPSIHLESGRLLLEAPDRIAFNPDGHGGSLRALSASGVLDGMMGLGIEVISYFQVDNPLVHAVDPVFIGLHADPQRSSQEMSSKAVLKRDAAERVGVFATGGGANGSRRTCVVEYSDLPEALATATADDGGLLYKWGSIAVHMLSAAFVRRLTEGKDLSLPFHPARKAIRYLDPESGEAITPSVPDTIKLETFVFDALPLAERSVVMVTDRAEEFAPIKNARGEDSPATSFALQTARAAAWLEGAGVSVPRRADGTPEATIEMAPSYASSAAHLRSRRDLPTAIAPGDALVLE